MLFVEMGDGEKGYVVARFDLNAPAFGEYGSMSWQQDFDLPRISDKVAKFWARLPFGPQSAEGE